MKTFSPPVVLLAAALALSACAEGGDFSKEAGAEVDEGGFGNPTMNNTMIMSGELDYTIALGQRFASEVPTTINFAFDSAVLSEAAKATLRQQADWIRQFPEVRFRVYGHTDLVGSDAYNKSLGLRRAKATVAYLASQGISTSRLEAVASFGETQPLIPTPNAEEKNRRTVTEVSGFVKGSSGLLNGKYAEIIWRDYVKEGQRPHPSTTVDQTEVDPSGG